MLRYDDQAMVTATIPHFGIDRDLHPATGDTGDSRAGNTSPTIHQHYKSCSHQPRSHQPRSRSRHVLASKNGLGANPLAAHGMLRAIHRSVHLPNPAHGGPLSRAGPTPRQHRAGRAGTPTTRLTSGGVDAVLPRRPSCLPAPTARGARHQLSDLAPVPHDRRGGAADERGAESPRKC